MKLSYFPETDSLYIELADRPGADAEEIRPGIVVDLDDAGVVVGIDIERASQVLDLSRVVTSNLPYGAGEA
jgi:uncharacterized protein YuzE